MEKVIVFPKSWMVGVDLGVVEKETPKQYRFKKTAGLYRDILNKSDNHKIFNSVNEAKEFIQTQVIPVEKKVDKCQSELVKAKNEFYNLFK